MSQFINYINTYSNIFSVELVLILIGVLVIVSLWKVFEKAGLAGWKCLVPFYNLYCFTVIARLPWWYFLLMLMPWVGVFIVIYVYYKIAQNFEKGVGFTLGLIFLPFIFLPILAYGDSVYLSAETPESITPRSVVTPASTGSAPATQTV